jgi:hypothetical protein
MLWGKQKKTHKDKNGNNIQRKPPNIKGKVVCLCVEVIWGRSDIAPLILSLCYMWDECSFLRVGHLTPDKEHIISIKQEAGMVTEWVSTRCKRDYLVFRPVIEPRISETCIPLPSHYANYAVPAAEIVIFIKRTLNPEHEEVRTVSLLRKTRSA